MSGHFVVICSDCQKIVAQCKCISPDKVTKYTICAECAEKTVACPEPEAEKTK